MNQLLRSLGGQFMRSRGAAPSEVWPPTVTPDMYFDFDLGEGYWGGSAKALSDFIDDGSNSYRIQWGNLGISGTEDFTMLVEVENDALAPEATSAEELLSFKVSSSVYNYLRGIHASQPRGYNVYGLFAHLNPTASANVPVWNLETGLDTAAASGRQRVIVARENGAPTRVISSMGKQDIAGANNTNTDHPSSDKYLYINQRPSTFGTAVGTPNTSGLPIKRVALWGSALSSADMFTASRFERPGIVISGDSFVAGGTLRQELVKSIESRGKGPVAAAYDGVGSTGLTAHASRWASLVSGNAKWADEYLIIMDGGFETVDGIAAAKAAIDSYVSNLNHDKWVLVEPNPINALGTGDRDTWNDFFYGASDNAGLRGLYNYVGADHYIKTYETMLANGDGSANDLADIANGLWPRSLRGDATHPNADGDAILGALMADYAVAKKWV